MVSFWRLTNEIAPTCQKRRNDSWRLACSYDERLRRELFLLVELGFNGALDLLVKLGIGFQGVLAGVTSLRKLRPLVAEP